MSLRTLHLVVGFAGVAVFLGTGIYMRVQFPDAYAADEAVRYLYRANHVYVLFASLVNVLLGLYFAGAPPGWRAVVSTTGSLLALAAPVVLCFAFVFEAPTVTPERILTLLGVIASAAGVAAHAIGGAGRSRA